MLYLFGNLQRYIYLHGNDKHILIDEYTKVFADWPLKKRTAAYKYLKQHALFERAETIGTLLLPPSHNIRTFLKLFWLRKGSYIMRRSV